MAKERKGFHYAYVILASIALQKFIVCAENTTSGLFLLPVTRALGVSQGSYMFYQTVQYGVMALTSMLMPKLTARFRYMTLNRIGLVCMFLGLTCMSRAQNVYMFYLAGLLDGLGLVVCNLLLMGTLIPRWFKSRMGVMMATVTLLFTLPGLVLSPRSIRHRTGTGYSRIHCPPRTSPETAVGCGWNWTPPAARPPD